MSVLVSQLISEVSETSRNLSSAFRHMSLQDQLSIFPSVESANILRCISHQKDKRPSRWFTSNPRLRDNIEGEKKKEDQGKTTIKVDPKGIDMGKDELNRRICAKGLAHQAALNWSCLH